MRKILTLLHFACLRMVWLLVPKMVNFCTLLLMANSNQFCIQVPDKTIQLKPWSFYLTAINLFLQEDQMDYWLCMKNLNQNKQKIFTWEVKGNSTLLNTKERWPACWPLQNKMSWWLVWAQESYWKCLWIKMKSQDANTPFNLSTLTVSQDLISVWENHWSLHAHQIVQSEYGTTLKRILLKLSSILKKNLWVYPSIHQDYI